MIHYALALELRWCRPDFRNVERLRELVTIAADLESTDASDVETEELVAIEVHESRCHLNAVGDGGASKGPWQVQRGDPSAAGALAKLRWSESICGPGGLAPYAGARRCGDVPWVVASLLDPTIPRR
jgi:hypothetical protein